MPEVYFEVRWPDATRVRYYSPSRAVREQLRAGERYPVADFVARVAAAMEVASARVESKYGYRCSSAADTLGAVRAYAADLTSQGQPEGEVLVERIE